MIILVVQFLNSCSSTNTSDNSCSSILSHAVLEQSEILETILILAVQFFDSCSLRLLREILKTILSLRILKEIRKPILILTIQFLDSCFVSENPERFVRRFPFLGLNSQIPVILENRERFLSQFLFLRFNSQILEVLEDQQRF